MLSPIFIVGAQRSGTTYLQNLMGGHPEIATPQETRLWSAYLGPWHRHWLAQVPETADLQANAHRFAGLPSVLTEQQFRDLVRTVAEQVYGVVLELKPGASMVLDKVPENARQGREILSYYPDASFVHVIRDGRDVACSMLRAASGWGHRWAPKTAALAAQRWRDHVEAASELRSLTDRYTEVRYEDLIGPAGPGVLKHVMDRCGVALTDHEADDLYQQQRLTNGRAPSRLVWGGVVRQRLGRDPEEPEGFFGKGRAEVWKDEMSAYDRWAFDRVAGSLLIELGYAADDRWARHQVLDTLGPARLVAERSAIGLYRSLRTVRSVGD